MLGDTKKSRKTSRFLNWAVDDGSNFGHAEFEVRMRKPHENTQ